MPDTPPAETIDCEEGTAILYIQVPLTGDAAMDAVYEKVKHHDLVSIILDERYTPSTFRVEYRPKK
jgi:hypothetical protein